MPSTPMTKIAPTTQTQVLTLPAIDAPQQAARILDARRIVTVLAERFRPARLGGGARAIVARQGNPTDLDARAAVHPGLRVARRRRPQVVARPLVSFQRDACRAPRVAPQCGLAAE